MALRGLAAARAFTRLAAASTSRTSAAPVAPRTLSTATAQTAEAEEQKANHLNSMVRVKDVIAGRKESVYSAKPDSTVFEAIKTMVDKNIGCLVVVGEGNKVVGIISERDYLEKGIVRGRNSRTTPVRDLMSEKELVSVTTESTLTECMELMTAKRVRHIPVINSDNVAVSMVSIGDIVSALVESHKKHSRLMQEFIGGGY